MRKLKIIEHISLDGVIQHSADDDDFPYGDWTAPYRTPAGRDAILAAQGASPMQGPIFALFVILVAAAEAAVGLALVIALYRLKETVALDVASELKG